MKLHPDVRSTRSYLDRPKVYLAGPFFSPAQLEFIESLEAAILDAGFELFSPRLADDAKTMNEKKLFNDDDLRHKVFTSNVVNISDSALMVAVVDDRDTGTTWEMGYASAKNVPIFTVTNEHHGMNLMLAHCIIGHCKFLPFSFIGGLKLLREYFMNHNQDSMQEFEERFMSPVALKEGPSEHEG